MAKEKDEQIGPPCGRRIVENLEQGNYPSRRGKFMTKELNNDGLIIPKRRDDLAKVTLKQWHWLATEARARDNFSNAFQSN